MTDLFYWQIFRIKIAKVCLLHCDLSELIRFKKIELSVFQRWGGYRKWRTFCWNLLFLIFANFKRSIAMSWSGLSHLCCRITLWEANCGGRSLDKSDTATLRSRDNTSLNVVGLIPWASIRSITVSMLAPHRLVRNFPSSCEQTAN